MYNNGKKVNATALAQSGCLATEKILIVDDEESMRDLTGTYLSGFGFEYDTAENGEVAVNKLREGNFTIVVTDLEMPRMDGMQLLKYICGHHPNIGVIVVTGGTRVCYSDVIKAGASDFISKPFRKDELEAKLNRIVRELNMIRQLERDSLRDGLTDLYNRRSFDHKILREVKRAERQRHKIFLMMIDVDNLKYYNDAHGHQGGDKLLQSVGRILLQSTRENVDWPFRYGGDEFCVLFSELDLIHVATMAERILEKYVKMNFTGTGLSVGIARFIRYTAETWQENIVDLVFRADKALYKAKHQGKNQFVFDNGVQQEPAPFFDRRIPQQRVQISPGREQGSANLQPATVSD